MREIGSDTQSFEVKEAAKGLPKSILSTLSAFSNRYGGTIILGLSEQNGFKPASGFNAPAISDALVTACDRLTPPCRISIETFPFEGASIIAAEVLPMEIGDRPCYVTDQGLYGGSYIRTGDGDKRMTRYEIDRIMEFRRQPNFDIEPVYAASMEDLDPKIVPLRNVTC